MVCFPFSPLKAKPFAGDLKTESSVVSMATDLRRHAQEHFFRIEASSQAGLGYLDLRSPVVSSGSDVGGTSWDPGDLFAGK